MRKPPSGLARVMAALEPAANLRDLRLPEPTCELLREMAGSPHVGHAIALFVGTDGDTMRNAAAAVARERGLTLYRIDLTDAISKYVGETEASLGDLLEWADARDSALFFDDAGALFGQRGDARDGHDRHANADLGDLLQRIERYAGLVVLATNDAAAVDDAFVRRVRYIVEFSGPS